MDRRTFMGAVGSSLAAAALPLHAEPAPAALPLHAEPAPGAPDSRPNFLFMIADDMTFRTIGALNNPEVHTPNLDRLAARGTAFTHCFHQGSLDAGRLRAQPHHAQYRP